MSIFHTQDFKKRKKKKKWAKILFLFMIELKNQIRKTEMHFIFIFLLSRHHFQNKLILNGMENHIWIANLKINDQRKKLSHGKL